MSIGTFSFIFGVGVIVISFLISKYIRDNIERQSMPDGIFATVILLLWAALLLGMLFERYLLSS